MGRTKDTQNIRPSERQKTHGVIPVRDDSVPRRAASSSGKHEGKQPVRLLDGTTEEHHEEKYVAWALKAVPRGTSVLNWPCGCSRLLPLLKKLGYGVTSADSSSEAVGRIRLHGGLLGEDCVGDRDDFQVVNIFQTGFDDDYFGAAIVNQLCCLAEPQMRQLILKELGRICSGSVVVSFFCNTMIYKNLRCQAWKSHEPGTQHPFHLSRKAFAEEVRKCGLIIQKWMPRYGLASARACAILVRDKNAHRPSRSP